MFKVGDKVLAKFSETVGMPDETISKYFGKVGTIMRLGRDLARVDFSNLEDDTNIPMYFDEIELVNDTPKVNHLPNWF